MLDLPVLNGTLRDCGQKLPRTTNVGRSGDWSDLYYLVDYLTFAMDQHYESQPCRSGCSACCRENTVFRVSRTEWRLIEGWLETADPDRVDALLARNTEVYGPYLDQLRAVASGWQFAAFDAPNPALDGLPSGCPALEGDFCGIYDVRPLVCRAYGYMAATIRGRESLLICKTFGEPFLADLRARGLDHVPLPNFEPFTRQLGSLDGTADIKPLPLWLHEWAEGRKTSAA